MSAVKIVLGSQFPILERVSEYDRGLHCPNSTFVLMQMKSGTIQCWLNGKGDSKGHRRPSRMGATLSKPGTENDQAKYKIYEYVTILRTCIRINIM